MAFPWKTLALAIPKLLISAIGIAEQTHTDKGAGATKKQLALNIVISSLAALKADTGVDVLANAKVQDALARANDAIVAVQNAIAEVEASGK